MNQIKGNEHKVDSHISISLVWLSLVNLEIKNSCISIFHKHAHANARTYIVNSTIETRNIHPTRETIHGRGWTLTTTNP
jgi:hypothetical protein